MSSAVRTSFISASAILLLLFAGLTSARAGQKPAAMTGAAEPNMGSIRGRVVMPNGSPVEQALRINVTGRIDRGAQMMIFTDQQGTFEIKNLQPGTYNVEAEGDKRLQLESGSERVDVIANATVAVTVYLKEKNVSVENKPAGMVVSAGELDSKVPEKARQQFERASHFAQEGKTQEAITSLRKAIEIYPGYLSAHNDLGTLLFSLGKLDEAADELQSAIKLDPKAFNPQVNLGIVLVHQQRFLEAAQALDKALSLDSTAPAAHLYAGLAYGGLGEGERAEKELTTAYRAGGAKYALALFHLGQLYMEEGKREQALQSFEAYLRDAPGAANAEQVRRLVSMLR
jgi:tetratricopeptide (TPR) repeat protein